MTEYQLSPLSRICASQQLTLLPLLLTTRRTSSDLPALLRKKKPMAVSAMPCARTVTSRGLLTTHLSRDQRTTSAAACRGREDPRATSMEIVSPRTLRVVFVTPVIAPTMKASLRLALKPNAAGVGLSMMLTNGSQPKLCSDVSL